MSESFKMARLLCSYKHCRKIVVSIHDWVIRILHWLHLCGPSMALGSTQPLTEKSTVVSLGGRGVKAVGA